MNPFRIVPWHADFLEAVRGIVDELTGGLTGGRPGRAVIVFPNSRPRRYLTDLYRRACRSPMLLPRIMTGEELRDQCRATWDRGGAAARRAARLDQVALLKKSVEAVAHALPPDSPLRALGDPADVGGMARFLPWGGRLADLLEECLAQMVDAQDLRHAEGEVAPFAAALLGELRAIRGHYLTSLNAAGLSTPGLDAHVVARETLRRPPLPAFLQGKTLLLAGFVSLTRAEDMLFRYLWENGATVCLHTDPAVAGEGPSHWSCAEHVRWLHSWRADTVLWGESEPERHPRLHFFAGYDLHSQLQELRSELAAEALAETSPESSPKSAASADAPFAPADSQSRAVVLPDPSLLMPALHHLPRKDINISLGYPLSRSLLARLVETVLRCRESLHAGSSRHHWRTLLDLFRHPYVRMLRTIPKNDEEKGLSIRPFLRLLEQRLRAGSRLTSLPDLIRDLLDESLGDLDAPARREDSDELAEASAALLERVADVLVTDWNDIVTLRDVAARLAMLCELLLCHGRHIWPSFPIDAECLFRLMQKIIPALTDNAMADELLPPEALFAVVRQALDDERVPFEADPLTGLQVLGMLETRLLRFDRVYLLDLTEDRLPGAPRQDPLLPDNLRGLLGLPDTGHDNTLAAHTFYRLLAGARDVHLFWQEGVTSGGLQDAKKARSRFVEKALWDVEQVRGERLKSGEAPLRAAAFPLSAPPRTDKTPIPKTPAILARLENLLADPLSSTRLDAYLHCPARFFHETVCGIRPLEEVAEGDDPKFVGELIHRVLRQAYEPFVDRKLRKADVFNQLYDRLCVLFRQELAACDLRDRLPAESWLMLESSGPLRLRNFLEAQPDELDLLRVEQEYRAALDVDGKPLQLHGILDRIDQRDGQIVILDYKTGRLSKAPSASFWRNDVLWNDLTDWEPGRRDPLPAVADALPSVQLPFYLHLYGNASGQSPDNAAWVPLADDSKEVFLLDPKWTDGECDAIRNTRIPALLRFLLRHLLHASAFTPLPGKRCSWCPYSGACR